MPYPYNAQTLGDAIRSCEHGRSMLAEYIPTDGIPDRIAARLCLIRLFFDDRALQHLNQFVRHIFYRLPYEHDLVIRFDTYIVALKATPIAASWRWWCFRITPYYGRTILPPFVPNALRWEMDRHAFVTQTALPEYHQWRVDLIELYLDIIETL